MTDTTSRRAAVAVGALWFLSSAVLSPIGNTAFLTAYRDPLAHILARFMGAALIGLAVNAIIPSGIPVRRLPSLARALLIPSLCMFGANYFNSMAVARAGVSFTHTIKASGPLWTVLLCAGLRGERFTLPVYASLIPTVGGVALASLSGGNVDAMGLVAAIASTVSQALMNLYGKSHIRQAGVSSQQAFVVMVLVCTLIAAPLQILASIERGRVASEEEAADGAFEDLLRAESLRPIGLFALAALAYLSEYSLNFSFVAHVSPLTFSVADIGRRVATIGMACILFDKALGPRNIVGIAVAVCGVVLYTHFSKHATGTKKNE